MKKNNSYEIEESAMVASDSLGKQPPNFERINEIHHQLNKIDRKKGWPPIALSGTEEKIIPDQIKSETPGLKMFRKVTMQVMNLKKVKELLGEYWVHVNTQHITQLNTTHKGREGNIPHFEFRILFYSYSANHAIEVLAGGAKKITINSLFDIYIPETRAEIQNAIKIARKDPRISDHVRELEADAMLEPITDEKHPSFNNRVLRVMFSEKYDNLNELPVLYCALVDINERNVLTAGEAPCIQKPNK